MPVEDFAIIAGRLDCPVRPVIVEAERLAESGQAAEHLAHFRVARGHTHARGIRAGDPHFLGSEERVQHPFVDLVPLLVVAAHDWADRFFGEPLGQHHIIVGMRGVGQADHRQREGIGGHCVAPPGKEGELGFLGILEHDGLETQPLALEIFGGVEFGGRPLGDADRCAIEIRRKPHTRSPGHQEALPVIIHGADEIHPEVGVARQRPCRRPRQDVGLARLHDREALVRGDRHEPDLAGIAEDRSGERPAVIDEEALPASAFVEIGHAELPRMNCAIERSARANPRKRRSLRRGDFMPTGAGGLAAAAAE